MQLFFVCLRVQLGKFLLRAQLDCEVPTTKGNSMIIDLKTRATVPIRLDIQNYKVRYFECSW